MGPCDGVLLALTLFAEAPFHLMWVKKIRDHPCPFHLRTHVRFKEKSNRKSFSRYTRSQGSAWRRRGDCTNLANPSENKHRQKNETKTPSETIPTSNPFLPYPRIIDHERVSGEMWGNVIQSSHMRSKGCLSAELTNT